MYELDTKKAAENIESLIRELFPIHRTLVNEGFERSLGIINKTLPLEISEVPSGTQVHDWIVPTSWNVVEARIETTSGKVLIDFETNNLRLSAYSQEFNGLISHEELLKHLKYREDLPKAIPYNFHYYKEDWSFNVSYEELKSLFVESEYKVVIKTKVYDDFLRVGECYLPGKSKKEILITSYLCHPSMVNDNLSGVVVATELFCQLSQMEDREYSYRLIIIPETIGAVVFLSEFPEKYENVISGLTVYCCGYGDQVHYKRTYGGDAYMDQVADYTLANLFEGNGTMLPFWPGGSDERQFNSAGSRMPMGALTRLPAAEFKEYHTSLDNLEMMDGLKLADTLAKLLTMIRVIEADQTFKANYVGEPCFSRHNIAYPSFTDALAKSAAYIVKILANEVDGTNSLLKIAQKWDLNIFHLAEVAKDFEREQLITRN